MQVKAFLSYSSKDAVFASTLATDLRAAGVQVWFDKWEIQVGESIIEKIQQGISAHDFLIIVLSKTSVASPWVNKELNAATMHELDVRKVVILPSLLEDCPIPQFLKEKRYADFRSDYQSGLNDLLSSMSILSRNVSGVGLIDELRTQWQYVRRITAPDNGPLFCTLSEDSIVRLFSVPDGKLVRAIFPRYQLLDASISRDGRFIVVGIAQDGTRESCINIYDAENGKQLATHIVENLCGIFCLRESILAGQRDGTFWKVDYPGAECYRRLQHAFSVPRSISQFLVAFNEQYFAVQHTEGGIAVCRSSGMVENTITPDPYAELLAVTADGSTVAWSGDESVTIATAKGDNQVSRGHTDHVSSAAFSPDGRWLVAGDFDGGIYFYAQDTWECVESLKAHERKVGSIAFVDSGRFMISGGGFDVPSLRIWDWNTRNVVCTILGIAEE